MNLTPIAADEAFRREARSFLDEQWGAEAYLMHGPRLLRAQRRYEQALAARGWMVGQWPTRLGGADWSDTQRLIWEHEAAAACAPQISPHGPDLLGPLLREVGTQTQRERHLPPIAQGQVRWCEAFAEDSAAGDAGSIDFEQIRCTATPQQTSSAGVVTRWTLSGSKPWVLDLPPAGSEPRAWLYVLAATDNASADNLPELSLFLLAADAPGVATRPRPMIGEHAGHHAVHALSFENVQLDQDALLGRRGEGASYGRDIERRRFELPGFVARNRVLLSQLKRFLESDDPAASGLWADEDFRARVHHAEIELSALESLERRAFSSTQGTVDSIVHNGQQSGPSADQRALRLALASRAEPLNQQLADLQVDALGYFAWPFVDFSALDNEGAIGPEFAQPALLGMLSDRARAAIGAPREHLKNVIAKSVLDLPESAEIALSQDASGVPIDRSD